jgi:hypothetical protein
MGASQRGQKIWAEENVSASQEGHAFERDLLNTDSGNSETTKKISDCLTGKSKTDHVLRSENSTSIERSARIMRLSDIVTNASRGNMRHAPTARMSFPRMAAHS